MLTHSAIWDAIDALAERHGLSASGLAKLAGLDATAFNKSKRVSKDGRDRWPSTESLAKVLEAVGESFDQFVAAGSYVHLAPPPPSPYTYVPLLGLAQAGSGGFFDDGGFPAGHGWDEIEFPGAGENVFALEVSGESMMPLYRDGDTVIVAKDAAVRRGDRVVVKTRDGEVMIKVLARDTVKVIELHSINPAYAPRIVPRADVEWIARITWASQ